MNHPPAILLTLIEVHELCCRTLQACGCDAANAHAVADTITAAERDGCHSHGLFRLPGYITSLNSGKVNGKANPELEPLAPSVLRIDGDNGYAPLALQRGQQPLADCAKAQGIAALSIIHTHHFSALWIEVTALAEQGLCAFAFTSYMPCVAPAGGSKPFYGTNPMAFGWPRRNAPPMVFDQASAAMSRGEIMLAQLAGKSVSEGVGLDRDGHPTTDPGAILDGAQLAFGSHKGAALALMIELLVGPLLGKRSSCEAAEADNGDGGPARGGELLLAINPDLFGDPDHWAEQGEALFARLLEQPGTRLPADRRYRNREQTRLRGIEISVTLHAEIHALAGINL